MDKLTNTGRCQRCHGPHLHSLLRLQRAAQSCVCGTSGFLRTYCPETPLLWAGLCFQPPSWLWCWSSSPRFLLLSNKFEVIQLRNQPSCLALAHHPAHNTYILQECSYSITTSWTFKSRIHICVALLCLHARKRFLIGCSSSVPSPSFPWHPAINLHQAPASAHHDGIQLIILGRAFRHSLSAVFSRPCPDTPRNF